MLKLWIGMGAVCVLFVGGLLVAQAVRGPDVALQEAMRPKPTVAPTPGAIGSVGHLRSSVLWVDDTGLSAWNRAYENRDDKAETQIMHLFETLSVDNRTPVMVTNRSRSAVQVEVQSGPLAGRRGWTDADNLVP